MRLLDFDWNALQASDHARYVGQLFDVVFKDDHRAGPALSRALEGIEYAVQHGIPVALPEARRLLEGSGMLKARATAKAERSRPISGLTRLQRALDDRQKSFMPR